MGLLTHFPGNFIILLGAISILYLLAQNQKIRWPWDVPAKPERELNPGMDLSPEELGRYYFVLTPPRGELQPVVIGERARFQHTQVIGSSGTGKTFYAMLPGIYQDIRRGAGVVIFDPKSAMRRHVEAYAKAAGRTHDLLCLDLADPDHSLTYSALVGNDPADVANRVWTAFFQDDQTPTAFYREGAMAFCRNFFAICKRLGVLPTFAQLRSCAADIHELEKFVLLDPDSEEAKELKRLYLGMKPGEYNQVFLGFVNKLSALSTGGFARTLNTTAPHIDLSQVAMEGKILWVGLAADRYPSDYRYVSTMLLMDLQSCLTARYSRDVKPLFLYMDEFADLLYPKVRDLIAKAREAKVAVTFAHQSLGDLKAQGEAMATSLFESSSNKVVFRVGTPDTAEQLAKLAGTKTFRRDLVNYSLVHGGKEAKGMTTVEGEEFLFHPNELKNLGVGEAFMVVQRHGGRELHRGRTFDFFNDAPVPPLPQGSFLELPARPAEYKPLVLSQASAMGGSRPKPGTPQAAAALKTLNFKPRGKRGAD